jgi:hypothetical protein
MAGTLGLKAFSKAWIFSSSLVDEVLALLVLDGLAAGVLERPRLVDRFGVAAAAAFFSDAGVAAAGDFDLPLAGAGVPPPACLERRVVLGVDAVSRVCGVMWC